MTAIFLEILCQHKKLQLEQYGDEIFWEEQVSAIRANYYGNGEGDYDKSYTNIYVEHPSSVLRDCQGCSLRQFEK